MIKRLIIFLGWMVLAWQGIAQNQIPDMDCSIRFSTSPDSAFDPNFWGEANYYRVKSSPYLPTYTNLLTVFLKLPTEPLTVWILEKQGDDSMTTVGVVTNLYYLDDSGYYFQQQFTLNTNQIHSLIAGNWFVTVDFGESNYVANLAPQYAFANGPTAVMVFPPVYDMILSSGETVIATDNHAATIVFDGSHSTDPFYLPMEFEWVAWNAADYTGDNPVFTKTGVLTTNIFELGFYTVNLHVSDSLAAGKPYSFYVRAITAGQAVNEILSSTESSTFTFKQKKIMNQVLSIAAGQFDQGHMGRGCATLELFKKLIKVFRNDSSTTFYSTYYYTHKTQVIIDAFKKAKVMR